MRREHAISHTNAMRAISHVTRTLRALAFRNRSIDAASGVGNLCAHTMRHKRAHSTTVHTCTLHTHMPNTTRSPPRRVPVVVVGRLGLFARIRRLHTQAGEIAHKHLLSVALVSLVIARRTARRTQPMPTAARPDTERSMCITITNIPHETHDHSQSHHQHTHTTSTHPPHLHSCEPVLSGTRRPDGARDGADHLLEHVLAVNVAVVVEVNLNQ
jgi:hypothetical protein